MFLDAAGGQTVIWGACGSLLLRGFTPLCPENDTPRDPKRAPAQGRRRVKSPNVILTSQIKGAVPRE